MSEPRNGPISEADREALFQAVFGSELGAAALNEILRYCGVGRTPFDANGDRQTVYRCGKLDVGLWIRRTMKGKE